MVDCAPQWLKQRPFEGMDFYRSDPYAGHIVKLHEDYAQGIFDSEDVGLSLEACIDDGVATPAQAEDLRRIIIGGLPCRFDSDRLPLELFIPDGLLGEITEWIVRNMSRHQPEFGLMSALQTMAAALSRRVKSDTGEATNLYQLLIGPSASGKDWPLKAAINLLTCAGGGAEIGTGSLTSPTAALVQLREEPAILFPIDEAGKTIGAHKSRNADGPMSELITFLLKAWSSTWDWRFRHKGMADKERNIEICCPHVSLLGVGTPESMYGHAIDMTSLSDGLMSRMVIFDTGDNVPPLIQVARTEPPESICKQLRKWIEFQPSGDLGWKVAPTPKVITTSPEARKSFQAAIVLWDLLADRLPHESGASAYRRCAEHARKYALIRACSEKDPEYEIVIQQHHADWSIALTTYLTGRILGTVKSKVVASQREKDMVQVVKLVQSRKKDNKSTSVRDVTRKFRKWDTKYRTEIIGTLVESGELISTKVTTGGRDTFILDIPPALAV